MVDSEQVMDGIIFIFLAFILAIIMLFVLYLLFKQYFDKELVDQVESQFKRLFSNFFKKINGIKQQNIQKKSYGSKSFSHADKIRYINKCVLECVKPVNNEASIIYTALRQWLREVEPSWHISFEVCVGSFIHVVDRKASEEDQKKAFSFYNSKRVDFLIINKVGIPKIVIEYNGSGHFGSTDKEREDAIYSMQIKEVVFKKASIPLVIFDEGDMPTSQYIEKKRYVMDKMNEVYAILS